MFWCAPKANTAHQYRETVELGEIYKDAATVDAILAQLEPQWMGADYHMMRRNCCDFCTAFGAALETPVAIPGWLNSLAKSGSSIVSFFKRS